MPTRQDRSSKAYRAKGNSQESASTPQEYDPEDFSQQAINRGQRKINYALTTVDQKLAGALEALKEIIKKTSLEKEIKWETLDKAIADVKKTSYRVADIKPPGCDSGWD